MSDVIKNELVVTKSSNYTLIEIYDTRGNVSRRLMLSKEEAEEIKSKL